MAYSVNKAQTTNNDKRTGSHIYPGTFLAEVMHNQDPQKAGRLWVFISEFGYKKDDPASWIPVSYASPFYGISPHSAPKTDTSSGGAQQEEPVTTYGFWAIPPDVGVKVLCTFVEGNLTYGYWYAVVPTISHSMIPAMGAPDGKSPVMDINPLSPQIPVTEDLDSLERQPYEPLTAQFSTQGIQEDPLRGPITSSSFRESPSKVFGISSQVTPESPGHTFVMDDGDAEGKNKLIRLRTAGGNQITMHDDTGMIYLINAQGTGWIEISPSGQIDVFGAAGINMATPGEINLHADKNVNIHAGECVKIVGMKGTKVMGGEELQLHGAKTMIEGVDSLHVHSCKEMMFTSFGDIHMKAFNYFCLKGKCFYWNSCTAKEAEQVPPEQPNDVSGYKTTVARAPNKEPYKEHDGGQGAGSGGSAGAPAGGMDSASTSLGGGFNLPNNTTMGPAMDTAATSLGGNFNLSFSTPFNNVGKVDTPATSLGNNFQLTTSVRPSNTPLPTSKVNPVPTNSASSMGMSFTQSPTISNPGGGINPTVVDSTALNNATRTQSTRTSNLANISTGTSANSLGTSVSGSTTPNTITTTDYTPATQAGPVSTEVLPASLTATTSAAAGPNRGLAGSDTTQTLTQENAAQNPDVFTSQNPADQALTGNTPAQEASNALGQMGGMTPSSDLPAAPGGGGTGCFATGDNCDRPVDETGGTPGNADPNANAAQTNFAANNPEGKAAAEAYLGRPMSDSEYNALVAATAAEAGTNQTEQAWVSGTILNRARASGLTVNQVLNQPGQFEAVTGPGGNANFINGPNASRASSINGSMTNILSNVPKNNYYFDAANPAAYKYGSMPTNRGGVAPSQIGASRFYPGANWP